MAKRSKKRPSHLRYQTLEKRQLLATLLVDTAVDSTGDTQDGRVSLREAIGAANSDTAYGDAAAGSGIDRIEFAPHLAGKTFQLQHGELQLHDGIVVEGGITIDGMAKSRILSVHTTEPVTLNSLGFRNGMAATGGAIQMFAESKVTINNAVFSNNVAADFFSQSPVRGGAIANIGGRLVINDSTFNQNLAISGFGGAIYSVDGRTEISDTFLMNNEAEKGGAVFIESGSMRVSGTDFTTNGRPAGTGSVHTLAEPVQGGAISIQNGQATVEDTTFDRNGARSGGAIYLKESKFLAVDAFFVSNEALTGGAIAAFNTSVKFVSSFEGQTPDSTHSSNDQKPNFEDNVSRSYGGAIHAFRSELNFTGPVFFEGNEAAENGGAIFGIEVDARFDQSIFVKNEAVRGGGGIFLHNSKVSLLSTKLINNFGAFGGGIYVSQSNLRVSGAETLFSGNAAIGLSNSQFEKHGGAIFSESSSVTLVGNDSSPIQFEENTSNREGGAIFANRSSLHANNINFYRNFAKHPVHTLSAFGGAVALNNSSTALIMNSSFDQNGARQGGAISVQNDSYLQALDAVFQSNSAQVGGGGLYVGDSSRAKLNQTQFGEETNSRSGNWSTENGGGAIENRGDLFILNSTFNSNYIFGYVERTGGGAILNSGTAKIRNSSFLKNSSETPGGAIMNRGPGKLLVRNSHFDGNESYLDLNSAGGAIHSEGKSVNLFNTTFTANRSILGGALSISQGELIANKVTFGGESSEQANVAGWPTWAAFAPQDYHPTSFRGGAIYIRGDAAASISQSRFLSNSAHSEGGAIAIEAEGDRIPSVSIFGETVFSENQSVANVDRVGTQIPGNHRGGAIYNIGGDLTLRDSYFAENESEGEGGAIFTTDNGKSYLRNVVLRDNESSSAGGAIFNDALLTVVDSRIANNSAATNGAIENGDNGISRVLNTDFVNNS